MTKTKPMLPTTTVPKPATERPDPAVLQLKGDGIRTSHRVIADGAIQPEVLAAGTIARFSSDTFHEVGITDRMEALEAQVRAVQGGDMKRAEAMLVAQAHSLDAIFNEMARRAAHNMREHVQATEIFMRLALRAQSQSRATLETLAAIKNPPVIFAKQANIAHGPQQVNNGIAAPVARTEEKTIKQPELMEHDHGQRLDTGTTGAASRADPAMATLEPLDRAANSRRKSSV